MQAPQAPPRAEGQPEALNLAVRIAIHPLETELSWPPLQPQEFESMYGVNAELFDMADEMLRPQRSEV